MHAAASVTNNISNVRDAYYEKKRIISAILFGLHTKPTKFLSTRLVTLTKGHNLIYFHGTKLSLYVSSILS